MTDSIHFYDKKKNLSTLKREKNFLNFVKSMIQKHTADVLLKRETPKAPPEVNTAPIHHGSGGPNQRNSLRTQL